jgi:hypothetical protein
MPQVVKSVRMEQSVMLNQRQEDFLSGGSLQVGVKILLPVQLDLLALGAIL